MNTIKIGNENLEVCPSDVHEWTLDSKSVALGYGVTPDNIRRHKSDHADELLEGKHWFTVSNPHAGNSNTQMTFWTKRGVIRLGFFIKSARAKTFRDLAEDLILDKMTELPRAKTTAEMFLESGKVMLELEQKIHAVQDRQAAIEAELALTPINSLEVKQISDAAKAVARLIGKKWHLVWSEFNKHFNLASYRDLPRSRFIEALEWLRSWHDDVLRENHAAFLEKGVV